MNKRTLAFASLAAVSALVFVGCSAPGAAPQNTPAPTPTETATEEPTQAPELGVAWVDGGNAFALRTYGSGSRNCYPNIGDVAVNGSEITVRIDPLVADQMCTMDYRSQLSLIDAAGVDAKSDVTVNVEFTDLGETFEAGVLPAIEVVSPAPQGPSAGWFDQHTIALLTYGTGTVECWPIVKDVIARDTDTVIEFELPTYAGACTADYAPQLHEVYIDDTTINSETAGNLVLNGAGFDNEPVLVVPGT